MATTEYTEKSYPPADQKILIERVRDLELQLEKTQARVSHLEDRVDQILGSEPRPPEARLR